MKKLIFFTNCSILLTLFTLNTQLSFGNQLIKISLESNLESMDFLVLGYYYGSSIRYIDTIFNQNAEGITLDTDHPGVYCFVRNNKVFHNFYLPYMDNRKIDFGFTVDSNFNIEMINSPKESTIYSAIKQKKNISGYEIFLDSLKLTDCDTNLIDFGSLFLNPTISESQNDCDTIEKIELLKHVLKLNSKNYLSKVNFNNSNLIYFPAFIEKIDFFLDKISSQHPRVLEQNISDLVDNKKLNKNMRLFIIQHLLEKYEKEGQVAGYEYNYVSLIEKYIIYANELELGTSELRNYQQIFNRTKPLILYEKAPDFILQDRNKKEVHILNSPGEYTLLFFYDFNCHSCIDLKNDLIKMNGHLKAKNIQVISICLSDSYRKWKKHINNQNLENWVYTFDNSSGKRAGQIYQISSLPTLYLLDNKHNIVLKKFHLNDFREYLENTN